ncbi:hypothetical protein [Streptococcus acidominimus]|uniref:Uncharacterized protein n=2 Tax=Streptococcus acidominimus TaxID=1326 RepID=A0A1Q8ECP1_STRAI|nr:hypothetical protein [Streptococcus acidominimus]OLF49545.1 hypothetical protein BU200_06830 [Streptococcus acidominimus]SUN07093.1 Uncharacterised protein [Streptococcus acidominimus]
MALEKEELVGLIGQLYGESEVVKGKLNVSFQGEGYVADLVADYCREIHQVMFPDNLLSGGQYKAAKRLLAEFKERCTDQEAQARVYLQFALDGTRFTDTCGDMPVAYYNALLHSYQIAVDVAEGNEDFFDSVKEELLYIYQTSQDIGWGFSEGTMDIFCQVSWMYDEED